MWSSVLAQCRRVWSEVACEVVISPPVLAECAEDPSKAALLTSLEAAEIRAAVPFSGVVDLPQHTIVTDVRLRIRAGSGGVSVAAPNGKYLGAQAMRLLEARLQRVADGSDEPVLAVLRHLATEDPCQTVCGALRPLRRQRGDVVLRRVLYFHHLCSALKRQWIARWAEEAGVGGLLCGGQPGLAVLDGDEAGLRFVEQRVRLFSWRELRAVHCGPLPRADACRGFRPAPAAVVRAGAAPAGRDRVDFAALAASLPPHLRVAEWAEGPPAAAELYGVELLPEGEPAAEAAAEAAAAEGCAAEKTPAKPSAKRKKRLQ